MLWLSIGVNTLLPHDLLEIPEDFQWQVGRGNKYKVLKEPKSWIMTLEKSKAAWPSEPGSVPAYSKYSVNFWLRYDWMIELAESIDLKNSFLLHSITLVYAMKFSLCYALDISVFLLKLFLIKFLLHFSDIRNLFFQFVMDV